MFILSTNCRVHVWSRFGLILKRSSPSYPSSAQSRRVGHCMSLQSSFSVAIVTICMIWRQMLLACPCLMMLMLMMSRPASHSLVSWGHLRRRDLEEFLLRTLWVVASSFTRHVNRQLNLLPVFFQIKIGQAPVKAVATSPTSPGPWGFSLKRSWRPCALPMTWESWNRDGHRLQHDKAWNSTYRAIVPWDFPTTEAYQTYHIYQFLFQETQSTTFLTDQEHACADLAELLLHIISTLPHGIPVQGADVWVAARSLWRVGGTDLSDRHVWVWRCMQAFEWFHYVCVCVYVTCVICFWQRGLGWLCLFVTTQTQFAWNGYSLPLVDCGFLHLLPRSSGPFG